MMNIINNSRFFRGTELIMCVSVCAACMFKEFAKSGYAKILTKIVSYL